MYENAFLQNNVNYDSNDDFLSTIRHEALYCAYILTRDVCEDYKLISISSLSELPENLDWFNNNLYKHIELNNKLYTYGMCLFNKWCGFTDVILNKVITKKQLQEVSKAIFEYHQCDSKLFYDNMYELEKKLMFFISITTHIPTVSLFEMISVVDDDTHQLIQKIPSGNAYLAYHINNALIDRCLDKFPQDLNLYKLYKSGSRFSKVQLARSCINIGLVADENNIVHQTPITTSLIEGLTAPEFFSSAPGTRKGLIDKERSVPESGYLERTLVMALKNR